jgi:nucleoside-diphosphate-sugar epimerase
MESRDLRMLVLGGSWLYGRLIVDNCARRGFDVTVFNGRRRPHPLPEGVRFVCGDRTRDEDLRGLVRSGPWDAVVDIAGKAPAVVRRSARALAPVAERYVTISTVSVYRDWPDAPVDEGARLWDGDPDFDPGARKWDADEYSRMKVGCELACRAEFGDDRLLIVRLHAMLGQCEDADPVRWWLDRAHRGGPLLVPGPDRAIQAIDVRDAARFVVDQVQRGAHGAFNVGAPADGRTYGDMVRACAGTVAAGALAAPKLVWVDEDWLVDQGVRQWTELPLWRNAAAPWSVSVDRAVAAGLRCRPLADTAADTWRWLNGGGRVIDNKRLAGYGIDQAREATLIARWQKGPLLPTERGS